MKHSLADEPVTQGPVLNVVRLVLDTIATWRVGVVPANDAAEFGDPRHGVIGPSGDAIVTDLIRDRMVLLDGVTGAVTVIATGGAGPGEIVEPTQLLMRGSGLIELLDNGLQRMTGYEVTAEGGTLMGSRRFEGQPAALCELNGVIVALDYDPITERVLHVVAEDGSHARSFGMPVAAGTNGLNAVLAQGPILCDSARDQVIYAPSATGDLVAYSPSGVLNWRRRVPDYFPLGVRANDGGVTFTYAPPPANRATLSANMK